MAEDLKIDDAVAKTTLDGSENLPASSSGNDRKIAVSSISNYSQQDSVSKTVITDLTGTDKVIIGRGTTLFNITWTRLKALVSAGISAISNTISLANSVDESITETKSLQSEANTEFAANIKAIKNVLANVVASVSGQIQQDTTTEPLILNTTPQKWSIDIVQDSTDENILEFDTTNDVLIYKQPGRYTFNAKTTLRNLSTSTNHTVTVTAYDASDDSVIGTPRTISVPKNTTVAIVVESLVLQTVLEEDVPFSAYVMFSSTDSSTDVLLDDYQLIVSAVSTLQGSGLSSIAEDSIASIRAIIGYSDGNDVFNIATGYLYEYVSTETGADDGINILIPDDNLTGTGAWVLKAKYFQLLVSDSDTTTGNLDDKISTGDEITTEIDNEGSNETLLFKLAGWFYNAARTFKAIFDMESLTEDQTYTMPDKSGTIALTSDLNSSIANDNFEDVVYVDSPKILIASGKYSFDTTNGIIIANLPTSPTEGNYIDFYFPQVDDINIVQIYAGGTYTIDDVLTLEIDSTYIGTYYRAIWDGTSNWDFIALSKTDSTTSITSIAESGADAIRNITSYTDGADTINYSNRYLYEFDSTSTGTDDGSETSEYLKPVNILTASAGRWIYRKTLGYDRENIFFEVASPDYGTITRGYDFKVSAKTDYNCTTTITDSSDVAYTLGNTVSAGDYLKIVSDTALGTSILTVEKV